MCSLEKAEPVLFRWKAEYIGQRPFWTKPSCLRDFVEFGADAAILYDAKPHIGTDVLSQVIANMRAYLLEHGQRSVFRHRLRILVEASEIAGNPVKS